jgi:aminomethyltransferase
MTSKRGADMGSSVRAILSFDRRVYYPAVAVTRPTSDFRMPVGTAFHPRTLALCESLNYREWAGYYAVSAFEATHEHEYNAIRQGAALIDITPLYKYLVTGRGATSLVDRVITRDVRKIAPGQVVYTPWCDERGRVIDDGTVSRLDEQRYRWTAADPSLRWLRQNAHGLEVDIEDISEHVVALALQGPTSAALLQQIVDVDLAALKYFRVTSGRLRGVPVDVSRTGYTGDLGYEIWMPRARALDVWDAIVDVGQAFGVRPTGMLALDVARIEAGLLLIDVDFNSVRKAVVEAQTYSPYEMGLGRLVDLDAGAFVGRDALAREAAWPPAKRVAGLYLDWDALEATYARHGLAPQVSPIASRVHVPVYDAGRQIGRATSTTWSPTLKRLIALATLAGTHLTPGTGVEVEVTVEAVRHRVPAVVVETPFFKPARKTARPSAL